MAPFGLIFNQDGSYGVWEASGMPPVPKTRQNPKNLGYWDLVYISTIAHYFPFKGDGHCPVLSAVKNNIVFL